MRTALVTGGGGFLGGAIVNALRARDIQVLSASRNAHESLDAKGVSTVRVDLGDPMDGADTLALALEDHAVDTVFHCAAKPGVWGPARAYEWANVDATSNVIRACRESGVGRLVFTSSPSAVFDGTSHRNAKNDVPYPTRYLAHYPRTKAAAERLVLEANGPGLATTALRPHLIFGPGDPNLVPRLIARSDAGRLRIVGSGDSEVSLTFVENGASAHLVAAEALCEAGHAADCAGQAYFVNDLEPVKLWEWINRILEGTGRPPVIRSIPAGVAYAAGALFEAGYGILRRSSEPPMTRFVAKQLSTSHSYDMAPFIRDTGSRYVESVGSEEATRRTIAWANRALPSPR